MALYLAADIGGTFTDFVVLDSETGELDTFKVFTTYPDRSRGLLEGVDRALAQRSATLADVAAFAHGSTIATNVLVEMRGAKCGLITTRGFRDLLELRRQKRPHLYDVRADKPEPLVPRRLRLEVEERIAFDGSVIVPLAEDQVMAGVERLVAEGVEAVAVMYLNSYANPAHELRTRELARAAFPHLHVYTSADVVPEFRELERLSTTVVNAFVGPPIRQYLDNLGGDLRRRGWRGMPLVMKGDGGVATPDEAAEVAVSTVGSGPAGGVRGALLAAAEAGETRDLITFDMGGTSTDISLVLNGEPVAAETRSVGGWPIKGRAVDVESIGAGGGSVAWVDAGRLLRVGPRSVGSDPGPACYGRGGTLPTITDANVLLGRLDSLLGGEYPLRADLAEEAVRKHLADPLGMSVEAAAEGILAVATAQMEQAIRLMTVARGYDPRDFTLVAFGGAGALHGPAVALDLGIPRVLVPDDSGVLSARGVLASDMTKELTKTRLTALDEEGWRAAREALSELRRRARDWALEQGADPAGAALSLAVDVRCEGQNYELTVPVPEDEADEAVGAAFVVAEVAARFHRAHERAYGYAFEGAALECLTYRARVSVAGPARGRGSSRRDAPQGPSSAPATRPARWQAGGPSVATPVLIGLAAGAEAPGPAIIEMPGTTIAVGPGQVARGMASGAIVIERTDTARRTA